MARILVRPNDFEEFIEVRPGRFSRKNGLEDIEHSYEELIERGFGEKKTITIDTYFFPDAPVWIANIPFDKKTIVVYNDPYDGLTVHYQGESPNPPTR
jgi:hypothetical protein